VNDGEITAFALAARQGDRAAAEAFVRATQAQLHRLLAYLTDARQAEDLAQETYLRAFASLRRFEARSPARMWLYAIARRVAADSFRGAARRPRMTSVDELSLDPLARTAAPDTTVALRQAIAGLDHDRREAFVLTQVLGLSYQEVAEICGCPVGTIRSRVFRARDDLVTELSPVEDDFRATPQADVT
jgi:RNA polymerase sigma-70 factor (ECF subfamily)